MGRVAWTKLEGSDLWAASKVAHAVPVGRTYHAFGHVERLYAHAATTFQLPNDPALDLAILAHDTVLGGPGAEARSMLWLEMRRDLVREAWPKIRQGEESLDDVMERAARYILATEEHRPTLAVAPMILVDLGDFLDPEVSRANTAALRVEARAFRGRDDAAFNERTKGYLAGLSASLAVGLLPAGRPHAGTAQGAPSGDPRGCGPGRRRAPGRGPRARACVMSRSRLGRGPGTGTAGSAMSACTPTP